MLNWLTLGMIYLGSILMVYNIYCYARYVRRIEGKWKKSKSVLFIPVILLVLFLLGYLAVGIFGKPDLIVAGILFGGSIFVCVVFIVLQTITDWIREEEHIEAQLIAAEESGKAKSDFLASMSHEMRTPLNAIIGLDTLLLKSPELPPESRKQVDQIGISARHLLELINNILDLNHSDTGSLTLSEEPFSLRETIGLVNAIIQNRCVEKGLTYQSSFAGEMDGYYIGDELKLRRVLINVLGNAAKYTIPPGNVTFTTEQIKAHGDERILRFTIEDTGIGMDKDYLPNLFFPFTRVDNSSTSRFDGGGMSLAVSKNIVELMHGEITVTSEKGVGSTFVVTVRLRASDQKIEETAQPENQGDENILRGRHILIAEDMELNAEIVAELLDMEGMTSDWAENGKIAVDMFSESPENKYDAILMDLRMPVMDGLEAAREIRSLNRPDAKTVPILALTANAFEEDVRNSLEAGMNEHLSKPVDADMLFNSLRWHLSNRLETD